MFLLTAWFNELCSIANFICLTQFFALCVAFIKQQTVSVSMCFSRLCSFMSTRMGQRRKAVGNQRPVLHEFVADVDLSESNLQDVPTDYNDEYNDVSSSFPLLENQNKPPQTFASNFEQNIPINDVSAPHLSPATTSHPISVPIFLADRATVHNMLANDAQANHVVLNPLITGQATYQKKRKSMQLFNITLFTFFC